jgi:hypothetical protein
MRRAAYFPISIVVIPLLALIIASSFFVVRLIRSASNQLPLVIQSAVAERINGDVTVGSIDMLARDVLVLKNVRVSDSSRQTVAFIPAVKVKYSLTALIRRRGTPIQSIRDIEVVQPRILLVRSSDGNWNFTQILKPTPGERAGIRAKIRVMSAVVVVRDYFRRPKSPEENQLANVEAFLNLHPSSKVEYSLSGQGPSGRLGRFSFQGYYNGRRGLHECKLKLVRVNLPYFYSYYRRGAKLRITEGVASATLHISKPSRNERVRLSGIVSADSGVLKLPQIGVPIRSVNGKIEILNSNSVAVNLTGKVASTRFVLSGNVSNLANPYLSLLLSSNKANYRELVGILRPGYFRNVRLPAEGSFKANIRGTVKSPLIEFNAYVPSLSYKEWAGKSILVRGFYVNKRLDFKQVAIKSFGGLVQGGGTVYLSDGFGLVFRGRVSNAVLSQVPVLRRKIGGETSGSLYVSYGRKGILVDYKGTVEQGHFSRYVFSQGIVDLMYTNGRIAIRKFSANVFGGTATVSGDIQDGNMKLQASGSNINLAYVGDLLGSTSTVGRLNFWGEITGSFSSPVFNGGIECSRVMISETAFQYATARVSLQRNLLNIHELKILEDPEGDAGEIGVSGSIWNPFAKIPLAKLHVNVKSVDVSKLRSLVRDFPKVDGLISADLNLTGSVRHLTVQGGVSLENGYYLDIPIDAVNAEITWVDGRLRFDKVSVTSGETLVLASGRIGEDKQISLEFSGERIDVRKYAKGLIPYLAFAGNVSIHGNIEGSVDSPVLRAEISSENLLVNDHSLGQVSGRILWQDSVLQILNLTTVSVEKSEYRVPLLTYDSKSKVCKVSAAMRDIDGAVLISMLESSQIAKSATNARSRLRKLLSALPRPLTGNVSSELAGTITLANKIAPNLQAQIDISDIVLGQSTIKDARFDMSWVGETLIINRFEALDPETNITANGRVGPEGMLEFQIDAHNLPVNALQQWFGFRENLSGRADVTIVASGKIDAPVAEVSIEIAKPRLGPIEFDRIRSRLSADGNREFLDSMGNKTGRIDITDLTFVKGDSKLEATGFVPVDWKSFEVPKDGKMILESQLDRGSLDLISVLTGLNVETGPEGNFEGTVRLFGTVASPSYEGYLRWHDGRLRIPQINERLTGIDAEIRLVDSKLLVDKFLGQSTGGGNVSVVGSVGLSGLRPVLDLGVTANKFKISARNLSNKYGEDLRTTLDADLRITGEWKKPLLSGIINVPEGMVALKSPAQKTAFKHKPLMIEPYFDIKALLGKQVQFRSARLRCPMNGHLAVAGSLANPVVSGALDISGGSILFPTRELRIQAGSMLRLQTSSDHHVQAFVDIEAQTRLIATTNLGHRRRYVVTMVATGPIDNLNPVFTSSPPGLTEERIVALLAGQGDIEQIFGSESGNNFGKQLSGLFSSAVMPTVFDPIERAFESTLGFEEFSLEMGYREPMLLTISDRLVDNLYLDYTATLGARPDYADSSYQFKLSYRFKHGLELGVTTDEQQRTTIGIEGRLRF